MNHPAKVIRKRSVVDRLESHFNFRDMVTPLLIRLTYAVGVLCILGFGADILINAISQPHGAAITSVSTIVLTLLALLLWRLVSEVGMLAFNLHARLIEIRTMLALRGDADTLREDASCMSLSEQ